VAIRRRGPKVSAERLPNMYIAICAKNRAKMRKAASDASVETGNRHLAPSFFVLVFERLCAEFVLFFQGASGIGLKTPFGFREFFGAGKVRTFGPSCPFAERVAHFSNQA
jgi:hypothetical protein